MGITIHFEGRLKKPEDYQNVIEIGRKLAITKNAEIITLDSDKKLLQRVKEENDWDYEGKVTGIQFLLDVNCEPIVLEFDKDLYIQEYCKTQFAGISTHIEVIQLLREIEPYFEELIVVDEGEFWETSDIKILEQKFENFFIAFDQEIENNPKLKGPIRLSNGRIIDLMD
jgi:hypothetical protein